MPWPDTRGTAPTRPPRERPDDRSRPLDPHTAPTADAPPRPSKSQRKREAHALQALGAQLVALSRARLARMALPDALREAVVTAQGLRPHGARRPHMQYIGTLMRQLDSARAPPGASGARAHACGEATSPAGAGGPGRPSDRGGIGAESARHVGRGGHVEATLSPSVRVAVHTCRGGGV
jgi:uncharacterized protein DUF615